MQKYTVLLVDDEPNILVSMKRALRSDDTQVVACADAGEALLQAEALGDVDVLISDNMMPGTKGIELLPAFRERFPDTMRIMLTGHSTLEDACVAVNRGQVFRFLLKPCGNDDLRSAVREALRWRDLHRDNQRLLALVQDQANELKKLKAEHPGIADVRVDADGCIDLGEDGASLDSVLRKYSG